LNNAKGLSAQGRDRTKSTETRGMTRAKAFNPVLRNNPVERTGWALIWIRE
jgi:hypothetical protein